MNRENESLKIGSKKIAIGLSWTLLDSKSVSGRKKKAEGIIKSAGLNYGLLVDNPENEDALLALTNEENKNSYIGGYLVADKISDAAFFTQIATEEEDGDNLYWLCAISPSGRVLAEYDTIVEENELAQRISDLESFSVDLKLYAPQECFRVFPDYEILPLELKDLIKNSNLTNYITQDLRKKTNYPLLVASVAALSVSAFMGYEYVYKENPVLEDIRSGVLYESVYAKEAQIVNDNKKSKNKKTMNQEEYRSLAISQLKEIYDRQFYSKEDIVSNISKMVDFLPQYLVEWELKQISYKENNFIFLYERIAESSGTFNQMKVELDKILSSQNIAHEWLGANKELTQASFRINFESAQEQIYINKKSNEQSKLENEKDPTKSNFEEIKKIKEVIAGYEYEADSLSFMDKRWGNKPDELQEAIIAQAALINGELNKIKEIYKKQKAFKEKMQERRLQEEVQYDVYYNSFLNKSQLHQSFNIGTPIKLGTLPKVEAVKEKKKKRSSKKKSVELVPVVNVYEFDIKSKESSTGLDQVEEAMRIIDNKSIIYFNVDYDIKTNNWVIRGTMYEANN